MEHMSSHEPQDRSEADSLFFRELVAQYLNPRETQHFLRRDWLAIEVERRCAQPDCRFVLVIAEPGFGKSTFIAKLARDHRDWPRYFIRRDQLQPMASGSARSFLIRLGYQLASSYPEIFASESIEVNVEQLVGFNRSTGAVLGVDIQQLIASPFTKRLSVKVRQHMQQNEGTVTGVRIEQVIAEPRFLPIDDLAEIALFEPARRLKQPLYILVDALDELQYHSEEDNILRWLTNCPTGDLPPNVRFILTSRPSGATLELFQSKQVAHIETLVLKLDDQHEAREAPSEIHQKLLEDTGTYVDLVLASAVLKPVWSTIEKSPEQFKEQAIAKAHANLGYLAALTRSLYQAAAADDRGTVQALLSLTELPDDLKRLYIYLLQQIRVNVSELLVKFDDPVTGQSGYVSVWTDIYVPVLSALAVALAPLTFQQLHDLGQINVSLSAMSSHMDRLRSFLSEAGGAFRLYHTTLAEVLVDSETAREAPVLFCDPIAAHMRIADSYLSRTRDWLECDQYGLAYLVRHILRAGAYERGVRLLTNFGFVEAKVGKLGLEELLSDLRMIIDVAAASDHRVENAQMQDVAVLLYREGYKLAGWIPKVAPGHFAQQYLYGTQKWDMKTLREAAQERLTQVGRPWWSIAWLGDVDTEGLEHTYVANAQQAAVIPNHDYLALQSGTTIRIWDLARSEIIHTLKGRSGYLVASPDGAKLITGNWQTLEMWNVETWRSEWVLTGQMITAVRFTPDSAKILIFGDSELQVWYVSSQSRGVVIANSINDADCSIAPNSRYLLHRSNNALEAIHLETGEIRRFSNATGQFVTAYAIAPDGEHMLVAYTDNKVIVSDVRTGNIICEFNGHEDIVTSIVCATDRAIVATGSQDGSMIVWNMFDGRKQYRVKAHNQPIAQLIVSPDGNTFASLGSSTPSWGTMGGRPVHVVFSSQSDIPSEVIVWDMLTMKPVFWLLGLHSKAEVATFAEARSRLIVGLRNGAILVWNLETNPMSRQAHEAVVKMTLKDRLGQLLDRIWKHAATQRSQETFQVRGLSPERRFAGHAGGTRWMTLVSKEEGIVSQGADDIVKVWKVDRERAHMSGLGHDGEIVGLVSIPARRQVVSASLDATVKVWDQQTGSVIHTLDGHTRQITKLVVTQDGQCAVTASKDEQVIVWNLASGQMKLRFREHEAIVNDVVLSEDGQYLISVSLDSTICIWELRTGRVVYKLTVHNASGMTTINRIVVAPGGRYVIGLSTGAFELSNMIGVALNENYLICPVIDIERGQIVHFLPLMDLLFFTPDRKYSIASLTNRLKAWKSSVPRDDPQTIAESGHEQRICSLAVSPDSRRLYTASEDATIKVWDLEQMSLRQTLLGHVGRVSLVQVLDDGAHLISAGDDRTVRAWSTATGEQVASVTIDSPPTCIHLLPSTSDVRQAPVVLLGDTAGRIYCLSLFGDRS